MASLGRSCVALPVRRDQPEGRAVFIVDLGYELDVQAEPMIIHGAVHMAPAALEQPWRAMLASLGRSSWPWAAERAGG
jgi:hypothetical protein